MFPLLALGGNPSGYVAPVSERLQRDRYAVSTDAVPYEFQRGGNQMMRVRPPSDQADLKVGLYSRWL